MFTKKDVMKFIQEQYLSNPYINRILDGLLYKHYYDKRVVIGSDYYDSELSPAMVFLMEVCYDETVYMTISALVEHNKTLNKSLIESELNTPRVTHIHTSNTSDEVIDTLTKGGIMPCQKSEE